MCGILLGKQGQDGLRVLLGCQWRSLAWNPLLLTAAPGLSTLALGQPELCSLSLRGTGACQVFAVAIRSGAWGFRNFHLVSVHFVGELANYREEL